MPHAVRLSSVLEEAIWRSFRLLFVPSDFRKKYLSLGKNYLFESYTIPLDPVRRHPKNFLKICLLYSGSSYLTHEEQVYILLDICIPQKCKRRDHVNHWN